MTHRLRSTIGFRPLFLSSIAIPRVGSRPKSAPKWIDFGRRSIAIVSLGWISISLPGASNHALAATAKATKSMRSPVKSNPSRKILAQNVKQLRSTKLLNVHTRNRYELQLFAPQGTVNRGALSDMREFLACHKTGKNHPIHWRLLTLLQAIGSHWPGRTIFVHSGYRHPSVSHHARRSNHTRGRAIDIRIDKVSNLELVETLARSFTDIGVGYYPNSQFVHLDIRERPSFWIDYAGPGQSACYSPKPWNDLLDGQAERLSYREAKAKGCKGHRIARAQNQTAEKPSPVAQSAK